MESTLRYTYRLRPGARAERALIEEWGRARWVWNQACERREKNLPKMVSQDLAALRKENSWLRDGASVVQYQALRTFWQTKGKRFKSRHRDLPSINYTRAGFSLRHDRLVLCKGISIPVVWSRPLPSEPSSMRLFRDSLGHWYVSFVVRRIEEPLQSPSASIGIDWGVRAVATTTDPAYDLDSPGYERRAGQRRTRYQRMMSRRQPKPGERSSMGYKHAKKMAAKTAKKTQRQRKDTAIKWAQRVVEDHGVIAVEDFKPIFLRKSTMARKASDNAVGLTKSVLIERAKRAGREVVLVKPAYTSMTCGMCGTRAKERLSLSTRTFQCWSCGHTEDRDRNAARAILATVGQYRAGAEAVRRPDSLSGEEWVLAEPGISNIRELPKPRQREPRKSA